MAARVARVLSIMAVVAVTTSSLSMANEQSDIAKQSKPILVAQNDDKPAGRVLRVGSNRKYKKPSELTKIVKAGDRILIDPGTYEDCAVWRTKNLTFEGDGDYAHITTKTCEDKGIWVFYAGPVTIKLMRFSRAQVINRNGAGIRWEGNSRLTVSDSWFDHNQMGILTHNKERSQLVVRKSRFERNGNCDSFCGHGIYAGFISNLLVQTSQFEGHMFGHHLKSRALHSQIVGNKFIDGPTGTASFAINLPNSGTAIIRYNFMQKGPKSPNVKCIICIGEEIGPADQRASRPGSRRNPSRGILIENNTFQNDKGVPTNFVWNRGLDKVYLRKNSFDGPGTPYRGHPKTRPAVR